VIESDTSPANPKTEKTVVVITGLSGAGKSYASSVLEDAGFYCVDNLPPDLIKQFVELASRGRDSDFKLSLVCDIRGGRRFNDLFMALAGLKKRGISHRIIFLEASEEILLRRFSETRRRHPLDSGSIKEDIAKERELLADVRLRSDVIIDTTTYGVSRLKEHVMEIIGSDPSKQQMNVIVSSFGFKYGLPKESDLLFDVRFLPNPHYVPELAPLTGQTKMIQNYVLNSPVSRDFHKRLFDFIDFLLPNYVAEGKSQLTIAFGCTGGRHRSVTFTELLAAHLKANKFRVITEHRDLER
jgi:UPF0042 nucleotide-binding protein